MQTETPLPAPPSPPPDADQVPELLQRWFRDRDRAALDVLLQRNLEHLQRYAHGHLEDRIRGKEDTGDVIQDAVVDFLHYSPPFVVENERQLRALLCRIVDSVLSGHRRWFSQLRRDVARERPLPAGTSVMLCPLAASDTSPSAAARDSEREAALRLAIAMLPPKDQRIVLMRTYQQLEFEAIGRAVDMKTNTVQVRFGRALSRLSHKLRAYAEGDFEEFLA